MRFETDAAGGTPAPQTRRAIIADGCGGHYNCGMIYLDNNATTRLHPEALAAMQPWLQDQYANPSSMHQFGQNARQAVEGARYQVATLAGCQASEVIFTSGGTEADNAAIMGVVASAAVDRQTIITSAVEHSAVREMLAGLAKRGWRIVEIPVDISGHLNLTVLEAALRDYKAALLTIMWANNETGVLFDVTTIGTLARAHGVLFHTDAVQTMGKMPVSFARMPIDLLSMSGHKFHGPKGVGALVVRRGVRWQPLIRGGPQERDRRGGTENVAGIVGMGHAAAIAAGRVATPEHVRMVGQMRDKLETGILNSIPESHVNGDTAHRLANTTNIGFDGLEAEAILILLSQMDICASAGAACSSGSLEPSHVLRAMHIPERTAHGSIRFSLSDFTTPEEIQITLEVLPDLINRLRKVLPVV